MRDGRPMFGALSWEEDVACSEGCATPDNDAQELDDVLPFAHAGISGTCVLSAGGVTLGAEAPEDAGNCAS
jgi:hypothetical protein